MIATAFRNRPNAIPVVLFCALALAGGCIAFPVSFVARSNVWIGFLLFPFALMVTGKPRFSYLFFSLALLFGILAWYYHVRMFYFFLLIFSVLNFIELLWGRVNSVILVLVALMSPFFEQINTILGFSFRLLLSNWAGGLLSWLGFPVTVEGNIILLNDTVFTVDEACAGLKMLSLSLLTALFILVYRYRFQKAVLPFFWLLGYFFFGFGLNILANLFRITLLVMFRVLPENPMHEVTGMIVLFFYVIIPLYVLSDVLVRKYGVAFAYAPFTPEWSKRKLMALFSVGVVLLITGMNVRAQRSQDNVPHKRVEFGGMRNEPLKDGITRLTGAGLLVYVKPIPEFFSSEHTPLFCWKGSGYVFEGVRQIAREDNIIYSGKLTKEQDVLYTAWWYTDGKTNTVDQFMWRYRMMRGGVTFSLVNITAGDETTLLAAVDDALTDKRLVIKD